MARSLLITTLLFAVATGVGCSDCDDTGSTVNNKRRPPNNLNNLEDMTNKSDMSDMEDMPKEDMDGDMTCEGNDCVMWKTFDDCEQVRDLGTLDAANSANFNVKGDTTNLASLIQTSCSNSGDVSAEYVFAFKVNATAFIDLKVEAQTGVDFVVEMRDGKCEALDPNDVTDAGFCRTSGQEFFLARKDVQYFLVVEAQNGMVNGPFDVNMGFTPTVCEPGNASCNNDDLVICEGGQMETTKPCGTTCMTDTCAANTCDNAIELSGTGTYDYKGSLDAFSNDFDAADYKDAGCTAANGDAMPTPGAEQIFKLKGLTTGQRVRIEANDLAEDQNDNAIFIMNTCGASAQCIAVEEISDQFDWEVPSNGDYVVIIDNLSNFNKNYKHTITISDP